MKRTQVLKRLKKAAKAAGVSYDESEGTRHTHIVVGGIKSTLKRHSEIDDITVGLFFDQFAGKLGKGWWR
jgi:hypothetical protein